MSLSERLEIPADPREDYIEYVSSFYRLLFDEIENAGYSDEQHDMLYDEFLYYGRYLNPRSRLFFERTVIPAIAEGLRWLQEGGSRKILDLGCGLGMQSIIFAAAGAKVVGVDIRPQSIELCQRRLDYLEQRLGRSLDVTFVAADFLAVDQEQLGADFDGVFSMSAFSYIQPTDQTVARLSALTSENARLFLYEENAGHFLRALTGRSRDVPRPSTIRSLLVGAGFDVQSISGASTIPRVFWFANVLAPLFTALDSALRRFLLLAPGYLLRAQSGASPDRHSGAD